MTPKKTKNTTPKKTKTKSTRLTISELKNIKNSLKNSYNITVNGKQKYPPFISNLYNVTGASTIEKIARIRLVLSTCKKLNIPLIYKNKFKSFSTLKRQCKVYFEKKKMKLFKPGYTPRVVSSLKRNVRNTRSRLALKKQNKTNEEQVLPDFTENHVTNNLVYDPLKKQSTKFKKVMKTSRSVGTESGYYNNYNNNNISVGTDNPNFNNEIIPMSPQLPVFRQAGPPPPPPLPPPGSLLPKSRKLVINKKNGTNKESEGLQRARLQSNIAQEAQEAFKKRQERKSAAAALKELNLNNNAFRFRFGSNRRYTIVD